MTKAKKAKRKKRSAGDIIRLAVVFFVIGGFVFTLISQQIRLAGIRKETKQCREKIALQNKEYERLKEKAAYSSSDSFYEEKARDEGYVRSDETVFVVGN